ncbi:hypothetical protein [Amycolatopsis sp. CA-230715]|uniref:hypothetical protein n=1 Tax=Amycolatopsis sp. CA-230715 TaxID=2745196 RepID=UPI001C01DEAB|nr:hypothetical protein [Amycolatopsis sp. CA-230715]QWF81092.1 hypothetical protein HUW46_04518 [Amycolatopsis sp. CA-230715]
MYDVITQMYLYVFPFPDRTLAGLALVMGVCAGITVWRMAWRGGLPGVACVGSWSCVARAVLLTGLAVVVWPGAILLITLCQFDGSRALIERFVFGQRPSAEESG